MELFLHSGVGEDPEIVEVEPTGKVAQLVQGEPDGKVWTEGVDEEIDLALTFEEAGIGNRHHVHRGRCRRVEVIVQFNSTDFTRQYGPGTPIKAVYQWASGAKAADLSAEQAAKHVLAVPGADHALAEGVHIGSLVTPGTCEVTVNLMARDAFGG